MEEVKRNITTFLEILQIGRTESIAHWDESNFKRAQQWARYAEEVYKKLKNKPSLVQLLAKHVNHLNVSDLTLKFDFSDLQHATERLRVILLQNPHLSSVQFSFVIEMYGVDFLASSKSDLEGLISDTFRITRNNGILWTLSSIKDELYNKFAQLQKLPNRHGQTDKNSTNGLHYIYKSKPQTTADVSLDVCGKLLWKSLYTIAEAKGGTDSSEHLIVEKLKSFASCEKGMQVILRMLVEPMEGERAATFAENEIVLLDPLKLLVFKWILDRGQPNVAEDHYRKLWSCPSRLLSRVSFIHIPFCKIYLNFLKSLGDSLLGRPSFFISQDTTNYGSSYRNVVQRFKELLQGPQHVLELCERTLKSWCLGSASASDENSQVIYSEIGVNFWREIYQRACR